MAPSCDKAIMQRLLWFRDAFPKLVLGPITEVFAVCSRFKQERQRHVISAGPAGPRRVQIGVAS